MSYQEDLTNRLAKASELYYKYSSETEFTDEEFDAKMHELEKLEKESGIVYPNSPTQYVGSDIQTEFKKCAHPEPMLTITNTYSNGDLEDWLVKMCKKYGNPDLNYDLAFNVSVKYDGISAELHYKDGALLTASTRGDKNVGDDITLNCKQVNQLPLSIINYNHQEDPLHQNPIEDFYVRGELLMPKSQLQKLNKELVANGKKPFANCRNACSGSVKQLDSNITKKRGLIFRPWDAFYYKDGKRFDSGEFASQTFKFDNWVKFNFYLDPGTEPWVEDVVLSKNSNDENVLTPKEFADKINEWHEKLKSMNLDYDFDGIVIKIDSCWEQAKIGTKDSRSIEWGIARKWNEEKEVITILNDVEFQVGRTGNITPVGKLESVECDGVIISNVTLHNEKFIKDLNLKINMPVKIVRSGSVIPYCVGTASWDEYYKFNKSSKISEIQSKDIIFPKKCPICGSELVKHGEIWKCDNYFCDAKIQGRFELWCSKECMDIPSVGPEVIKDLIKVYKMKSPLDLYMLLDCSISDIKEELGAGYGIKSISVILKNIQSSIQRNLDRIIFGLSIDGIGKQNSKLLAKHFGSFEKFINSSKEELINIDTIGPILAENIYIFNQKYGKDWLETLKNIGFKTTYNEEKSVASDHQILSGLNVVFTGSSHHWKGDQVEAVLQSYGAKCGHGVTKKLDYLITGDKPGPGKVKKATEIGIPMISEEDFIKKFNIPIDQSDMDGDAKNNYSFTSKRTNKIKLTNEEELF